MTEIKQKLLDALDFTLSDISEETLVDILIGAYEAKSREVEKLRGENAHEREMLDQHRDQLYREKQRMREDPTFFCVGQYWFQGRNQTYRVEVKAGRVDLFERENNTLWKCQQIPCGPQT